VQSLSKYVWLDGASVRGVVACWTRAYGTIDRSLGPARRAGGRDREQSHASCPHPTRTSGLDSPSGRRAGEPGRDSPVASGRGRPRSARRVAGRGRGRARAERGGGPHQVWASSSAPRHNLRPRHYQLDLRPRAERQLGRLPEGVATAALEFILGPLLESPHRVGGELRWRYDGSGRPGVAASTASGTKLTNNCASSWCSISPAEPTRTAPRSPRSLLVHSSCSTI
jgi:hypothetical protein